MNPQQTRLAAGLIQEPSPATQAAIDELVGRLSAWAADPWNPSPQAAAVGGPLLEPLRPERCLLLHGRRGTGKSTVLLNALGQLGARTGGPRILSTELVDLHTLPPNSTLTLMLCSRLRGLCPRPDLPPPYARPEPGQGEPGPERSSWGRSAEAAQPHLALEREEEAWERLVQSASARSGERRRDLEDLATQAYLATEYSDSMLDLERRFRHWVDLLLAGLRRRGEEALPLLVVPIDDADMQPQLSMPLLWTLRLCYHPRVAFVVAGDEQLLERCAERWAAAEVGEDPKLCAELGRRFVNRVLAPQNRVRARPHEALPFRSRAGGPTIEELLAALPGPAGLTLLQALEDLSWTQGTPPLPSRVRSLQDLSAQLEEGGDRVKASASREQQLLCSLQAVGAMLEQALWQEASGGAAELGALLERPQRWRSATAWQEGLVDRLLDQLCALDWALVEVSSALRSPLPWGLFSAWTVELPSRRSYLTIALRSGQASARISGLLMLLWDLCAELSPQFSPSQPPPTVAASRLWLRCSSSLEPGRMLSLLPPWGCRLFVKLLRRWRAVHEAVRTVQPAKLIEAAFGSHEGVEVGDEHRYSLLLPDLGLVGAHTGVKPLPQIAPFDTSQEIGPIRGPELRAILLRRSGPAAQEQQAPWLDPVLRSWVTRGFGPDKVLRDQLLDLQTVPHPFTVCSPRNVPQSVNEYLQTPARLRALQLLRISESQLLESLHESPADLPQLELGPPIPIGGLRLRRVELPIRGADLREALRGRVQADLWVDAWGEWSPCPSAEDSPHLQRWPGAEGADWLLPRGFAPLDMELLCEEWNAGLRSVLQGETRVNYSEGQEGDFMLGLYLQLVGAISSHRAGLPRADLISVPALAVISEADLAIPKAEASLGLRRPQIADQHPRALGVRAWRGWALQRLAAARAQT